MTDQKRSGKSNDGTAKKLQLKKETIKDLGPLKSKAAAVKGGRACCGGNTFTHDDSP